MLTRATIVKVVSVRLLDLIDDSQNLKVLQGDIGNAFIQAHTKEKMVIKFGSGFGDRARAIFIVKPALYSLKTFAESFRTMLVEFVHPLDFYGPVFGRDLWIRLCDKIKGWDYICIHVDDFKIVAKDPTIWINRIASIFLNKEHGLHSYYLGNDYTYHDRQDM